ncbi:hypothetical protein DFH06DRAFT_1327504 [Mycena polygramma]|nr:hypothetical protein DFH06DRAFT_1327504 [Mycena polygramma]
MSLLIDACWTRTSRIGSSTSQLRATCPVHQLRSPPRGLAHDAKIIDDAFRRSCDAGNAGEGVGSHTVILPGNPLHKPTSLAVVRRSSPAAQAAVPLNRL